jgi:hypothetical protein
MWFGEALQRRSKLQSCAFPENLKVLILLLTWELWVAIAILAQDHGYKTFPAEFHISGQVTRFLEKSCLRNIEANKKGTCDPRHKIKLARQGHSDNSWAQSETQKKVDNRRIHRPAKQKVNTRRQHTTI